MKKMVYIWAYRAFHTTLHVENNSTPRQLGNAMRKLLGEKMKTMPQKDNSIVYKPEFFSKAAAEGKMSPDSRRSKVLNKVFMRYITEIMATGQYSSEIVGHGIEINRVKITPNYKILNVFWMTKDNKDDDKIELILKKNAGYLRSELSQLRIMGIVPNIEFVKDKHYARIAELENRLNKADFGEDHIPTDTASKLKSELELYIPLDKHIKGKLQDIEANLDIQEDQLPPMTDNIFGLHHGEILERVKKAMKKSEALHRQSSTNEYANWVQFKASQTINENPINLGNEKSQQEAFRKFLKNREINRAKAFRRKNENPDLEYLKNELTDKHFDYLKKLDVNEFIEDADYIIDEEDVEQGR